MAQADSWRSLLRALWGNESHPVLLKTPVAPLQDVHLLFNSAFCSPTPKDIPSKGDKETERSHGKAGFPNSLSGRLGGLQAGKGVVRPHLSYIGEHLDFPVQFHQRNRAQGSQRGALYSVKLSTWVSCFHQTMHRCSYSAFHALSHPLVQKHW